ncbi:MULTISPECIES: protein kinase domain-containing protein [Actinomadura]|uniref:non-specific serine/threonine protein kinase n=1 Tax=Actinomadura yumaensis TaxID=111807 RepID=A0ABW2CSN5_9ACTN|nr:serine/threonine-protein kinase [Actinomadura sp. J1-007]MWK36266.1 protein kinase [Actinomadura sp. J1-007]
MSDGESKGQDKGRLLGGRYRLLSVVGSGGMGTVWRARDETLHREVAVKEVVLHRDLSADERDTRHLRTLREARASARLNHPGVVTVHDVVDEDGRPWIVMELVQARSLQEIVDEDGPQPPVRVAAFGRQIVAALNAAHAIGILHRDVKPANVLITSDDRAVLTDFGIAQMAGDATLTHAGLLMGSPAYMSPERVKGEKAVPASDLWALGATLYAAVEGKPPHHRTDAMAVLAAVMTQDAPPPRNAGLLGPVLGGLLERDPVQRLSGDQAEAALAQVAASAYATGRQSAPATGADAANGMNAAPATGADATSADPSAGPEPSTRAWTASMPGPSAAHPDAGPVPPDGPAPDLTDDYARTGPSGQAWMPQGATGTSAEPARRHKALVPALAGAAVAAVLAVAVAVMLWPDGGKGGKGDDAQAGVSPSKGAPSTGRVTDNWRYNPGPGASTGPSTIPRADPPPPLPPGFHRQHGSGYSVAVPLGWQRRTEGNSTIWLDPVSKAYVQVDSTPWRNEPSDPVRHWTRWEQDAIADGKMPGFRKIAITPTSAGARRAADIEFVWNRAGSPTRARDRGVYLGPDRAYAVMVAVPAARWNQYGPTVNNVLDSFRP